MAEPILTMCLCNYARPDQLSEVISCLKDQTLPIRIVVWDNSPDGTFKDDRADWVIRSSENMHTRHVIYLWQEAETRYVGRMDDDLYPADKAIVEDACLFLSSLTNERQMVGAYGIRVFNDVPDYSQAQHISIPKGQGQTYKDPDGKPRVYRRSRNQTADLLKGRFILANRKAVKHLRMNFRHHHSDLAISAQLAGRTRLMHRLPGLFFGRQDLKDPDKCLGRLQDFPLDDLGYCAQEDHMKVRDEITSEWVQQCFTHPLTKDRYPERKKKAEADVQIEEASDN